MSSNLHNLSGQTELALLGAVVHDIQHATRGLDMRALLDNEARQQLIALIEPEADQSGSRLLAQQSRVKDDLACRMLAGLCDGLRTF
jgi:hypothetical protein